MAIVVDTTALCDYCGTEEKRSVLDTIMETQTCYMISACAAEAVYLIGKYDSRTRAELIFQWVTAGKDIKLVDERDPDIVRRAAEMLGLGVAMEVAMSAAVARKMGVRVVVSGPPTDYDRLAARGLCQVLRL